MSDDDRDIDVESDDGDDSSDSRQSVGRGSSTGYNYSQAEKRAHHNALERKRRDHIKDSFSNLRDSVPALAGEKVASRAQILKKAADYINFMRKKNQGTQLDIDELKRQNNQLEDQVKKLEKQRLKMFNAVEVKNETVKFEGESDNSDGMEIVHHHLHMQPQLQQRRMAGTAGGAAAKKIKPNNYH